MSETTLKVHPHCLMFFVDETGHEEFADPNHPVFGLGGCAIMVAAIDEVLRQPWRALKEKHFGGAAMPLHASDLREPTVPQLDALGEFFSTQRFARFAVTMNRDVLLPEGLVPYDIMAPSVRRRFEEIASRCTVAPVEIALVHEASQRGDALLERFFGPSFATVEGKPVHVHHAIMPKGDECLEVADFIIQAAGGQARRPGGPRRKDFMAIFGDPLLSSYMHIDGAEPS